VQQLLDGSAGERREQILSGLHTAPFGGVYGTTRTTRIEATARKLADEVPAGSPTQLLYADLARAARRELERDQQDDEELDSGWEQRLAKRAPASGPGCSSALPYSRRNAPPLVKHPQGG
jgi:hypothetical protein